MTDCKTQRDNTCPSQCPACASGMDEQLPPTMQGWGLVAASVGAFIVPLALALVGAGLSGPAGAHQLLGATVGLTVGMIASILIARIARNRSKDLT